MEVKTYTIEDISAWMLGGDGSKVKLPAIQRGFVWRVEQIENLWDSIFRGYPVGSFLLSRTGDSYELFDGQQRATSIALGFYDPWGRHQDLDRIGNAKALPTVWVDLDPVSEGRFIGADGSEHLFRVLTKSHPWGYRASSSRDRLSLRDRTAAWEQMATEDVQEYSKLLPSMRLPYAARVPVPLCFLFSAYRSTEDSTGFREAVLGRCASISESFHPGYLDGNVDYHTALETLPAAVWEKWRDAVSRVLDPESYCVPAVVLPNEVMNRACDVVTDEKAKDPTLFVRLNAGGTNLQGEDLIYSIFKAYYPNGQELVEEVSSAVFNLIAPSRIIVLTARLVLSELSKGKYQKNLTSRVFQAKIREEAFRRGMDEMVEGRMARLMKQVIEILRMDDGEDRFVPDIVVKMFVKDSTEGIMLLLNFLKSGPEVDAELKKAIGRKLFRNYWFGNLADMAKDSKDWEASATREFWMGGTPPSGWAHQFPLLPPDRLEEFLLGRIRPVERIDRGLREEDADTKDIWQFFLDRIGPENATAIPERWREFVDRVLSSGGYRGKTLILLAQRHYIRAAFPDFNQLEDLDDTSTPWDWDHIYPWSWTWGGWSIEKDLVSMSGNFRAMSLVGNRSENNDYSPADRLSPKMLGDGSESSDLSFRKSLSNYFIDFDRDYPFWQKVKTRAIWSKKDDMKLKTFHEAFASAVLIRSVNIYRSFYDLFGIGDQGA